jgi:hypothetical protein
MEAVPTRRRRRRRCPCRCVVLRRSRRSVVSHRRGLLSHGGRSVRTRPSSALQMRSARLGLANEARPRPVLWGRSVDHSRLRAVRRGVEATECPRTALSPGCFDVTDRGVGQGVLHAVCETRGPRIRARSPTEQNDIRTMGGMRRLRRRVVDIDRRSFGEPRRPNHRGPLAAVAGDRQQVTGSSKHGRTAQGPSVRVLVYSSTALPSYF